MELGDNSRHERRAGIFCRGQLPAVPLCLWRKRWVGWSRSYDTDRGGEWTVLDETMPDPGKNKENSQVEALFASKKVALYIGAKGPQTQNCELMEDNS